MSEQKKGYTTRLGELLIRWKSGDDSTVNDIIAHSQERLRLLARKMLVGKPHVKRWQQTDDVLQNALIRLHRALRDVQPESKREFSGLAALQIRRELTDMARSLGGPEGLGRNYQSDIAPNDSEAHPASLQGAPAPGADPATQLEIHDCVGKLPDEEREVFDLLFYQGLTQTEVANLLEVSERTIKRRWRYARLALQDLLSPTDGESSE